MKREYKPFSVGLPSAPAPAEAEKAAEAPKAKKVEAAESSSGLDLDPRSIALPGGSWRTVLRICFYFSSWAGQLPGRRSGEHPARTDMPNGFPAFPACKCYMSSALS